jgi:hypothetical protein
MNLIVILKTITKFFLVKRSLEIQNINYTQNFIDNIVKYTNNFDNLSYSDRMVFHAMINHIN